MQSNSWSRLKDLRVKMRACCSPCKAYIAGGAAREARTKTNSPSFSKSYSLVKREV
jgi:hypothetical protein